MEGETPMNFVLFIVLTPLLFFVITTIFRQSYNILFCFLKKPILWIVFVGILSFFAFFLSSLAPRSYHVVWWALLGALLDNIPPKKKILPEDEMNKLSDEMLNIKSSRRKYRIGLFSFAFGGVLGWLIFFSEITVTTL